MSLYATIDPTTGVVNNWYDLDFADYPNLDKTKAIEVPADIWATRLQKTMAVINGKFVPYVAPPPALSELIVNAQLRLASIRYNHEIMGVSFIPTGATASVTVASDRDSQSKLIAAYVLASATPSGWTDGNAWKMADGSFVPLSGADAIRMSLTVQSYVSQCFNREGVLLGQIKAAATPAALAAIDLTSGWPSTV